MNPRSGGITLNVKEVGSKRAAKVPQTKEARSMPERIPNADARLLSEMLSA